MFFVRSKGDTEGTRAEILKLNPENRVRSMSEYVSLMNSSNLPELKPFIRTMVGLGVVISFLVVLMNMHTMILERTREIGILKALGFSRFDIIKMLLGETAFLTIAGSLDRHRHHLHCPGHPQANESRPLHPPHAGLDLRLHSSGFARGCPGCHGSRTARLWF